MLPLLGVRPAQFTTNAFKVIMESLMLNGLCRVEIGIAKINYCHVVTKVSHTLNSYYLCGIAGMSGDRKSVV